MPVVRLDKLVSRELAVSRKEAKALIRGGRVRIGGVPALSPDAKADPAAREITADGTVIGRSGIFVLMLNKPPGILCAARDKSRRTVVGLVPEGLRRRGLFPVGRLDRDTEGLLLLTDDGDFAHRVLSPRKKIPKVYEARLASPVLPEAVRAFGAGLALADGTKCLPAGLALLDGGLTARVTVYEGKYHQVRRMLAAAGSHVTHLRRLKIGGLALDPALAPGECRVLSPAEIGLIFESPAKENIGS